MALLWVASSLAGQTAPITVGPNVQVSRAHADATHYEVLAAADPRHAGRLIVGSFLYPEGGAPKGTVVYSSRDGGRTWTPTLEGDALADTSDPATAYGPAGTAYYTASDLGPLGTPRERRRMLLFRSGDGGWSWDGPFPFTYSDREYITVDGTGGRYHGRVYVNGNNRVPYGISDFVVFSSTDGGRTFQGPGKRAGFGSFGASSMGNAVVTSDGRLIGVFVDDSLLQSIASSDGGVSLEPAVTIDAGYTQPGNRKGAHNNVVSMPVMAIDRSSGPFRDRLYVVWGDRRTGRSRIYFAMSADGGATWSAARVIDDTPPGTGTDQFMANVAVNGAGVVGVTWYDRRDHADDLGWDVRFTASVDGGASFSPSVRVSEQGSTFGADTRWTALLASVTGPSDRDGPGIRIRIALNSFTFLGGDTAGLVADAAGVFHPVWVDNRTGVPQIWTAAVAVDPHLLEAATRAAAPPASAPPGGRRGGGNRPQPMAKVAPTGPLPPAAIPPGESDVSDVVTVDVMAAYHDPAAAMVTLRARLRNTSGTAVRGPFQVTLLELGSQLGGVAVVGDNSATAGTGRAGRTGWFFPEAELAAGAASRPQTWRFRLSDVRPKRSGERYGMGLLELKVRVDSGAAGNEPPSAPRSRAPAPAAGTLFLYPERIALADGGFARAERGMLFVPADRSRPDGRVIGLEVYRFPAARSADPTTPPIFRLFGGPSFPGLQPSLDIPGYYEREIRPFTEAADFVVIGQRGIGSSKPTTLCEPPAPVPVDADLERRAAALRAAAARCLSFWEEQGVDLSGMTVVQAAADVDDLRQALGYDRIQIWGGSFGSHWGMAVMRFHPEHVARAVLRGLEGPDHTYDMPSGVLNAVARIAAAADTSAALRDRIPPGGLLNALKDAIARVEREPVRVTVTDPADGSRHTVLVDGDAVRSIAYGGDVAAWPATVLALHAGDYTAAARAVLRTTQRPGYPTASFFMLDCGSGISAARAARLRADTAIAVVGDLGWWYRVNCAVWPSDLGEAFRRNFATDIPTVFVHGSWDTSTPLENARELAPFFKNLHFVLVKGGSHGALAQALQASPAFRAQLIRFFATGDMSGLPGEVALPPVQWVVPGGSGDPSGHR